MGRHGADNIAGSSDGLGKIIGGLEVDGQFYTGKVYIICTVCVDLIDEFFLVRPKQDIEAFFGQQGGERAPQLPAPATKIYPSVSAIRKNITETPLFGNL